MYAVIEIQGLETLVHDAFDNVEATEAALRNVKRRKAVTGECFVAFVDEAADVNESMVALDLPGVQVFDFPTAVVEVVNDGWMSFGEAARSLGVRYQQLYQRAVVKGKMLWRSTPAHEVAAADVEAWRVARAKRNE
jgi:predicted alpha/beta hydrolase family esterase